MTKLIMKNNKLIEDNFPLLNPPLATRFIAILDIAIYDAASYFHPVWLPLIAKGIAEKPEVADEAGAQEALAIAAYRVIHYVRH